MYASAEPRERAAGSQRVTPHTLTLTHTHIHTHTAAYTEQAAAGSSSCGSIQQMQVGTTYLYYCTR